MERLVLLDYQPVKSENLLIYYKGAFSPGVLSKVSMNIRKNLAESKRTAKKVFSIFIELAQNVSLYSAEVNQLGEDWDEDAGVGVFVIEDSGENYMLTVGNLVWREDGQKVAERIQIINSLNEEELRQFKIEQRSQPRRDGHHGANIGLIHVTLQAENPLDYQLRPIDDQYSFLLLHIKVSKIHSSNAVHELMAP